MSGPRAERGGQPTSYLGDAAALVRTGGLRQAAALAAAMRARHLPGVEDVVEADASVGVVVDPDAADLDGVLAEAADVLAALPSDGELVAARSARRVHEVPVHFDGEDLPLVARHLRMPTGDVVAGLCGASLEVGFLGFLPGFAYLTGLPPALASLDRLPSPRRRVPPGSVALGGGYAAIYPAASPGGWFLLGRTSFSVFDPDVPPYAVLSPGDGVRFVPVAAPGAGSGDDDALAAVPPGRAPLRTGTARALEIVSAGGLSSVQDRGRIGVAHLGIPRAGAFDLSLLARANLAVGNAPLAGALEVAGDGFAARCRGDLVVALATAGRGRLLSVDGRLLPPGTVVSARHGSLLELRRDPERRGSSAPGEGARAYLAVAGGVIGPVRFGSCSSDLVSTLGPGALRAGDELPLGDPGRPRGRLLPGLAPDGPVRLRVIGEPHAVARLIGRVFLVDPASDRTGVRIVAAPDGKPANKTNTTTAGAIRPRRSQAMVTGAVQLPPGGSPILLGPDHGTIGGYEVACTVITADHPLLAQLLPGEEVMLVPVSLEEAAAARREAAGALRRAVQGWLPMAEGGLRRRPT